MSNELVVVENAKPAVQTQSILTLPPREMVARAAEYAEVLADVIEKQKLYTSIQGKKYVRVEGWLTLGTMLGFTARERDVRRLEDGSFEATVDIIRCSDGLALGGASALCSVTEKRWGGAEDYARRSMAITRAVGKAYRINFSWILSLAGYETTPEEEMPKEEKRVAQQPVEVLYTGTTEQQRGIKAVLEKEKIAEDLWPKVSERLMNKPYTRTVIKSVIDGINA